MGARSWSSAPSVPSSHSASANSSAATSAAGPLFSSSSSSSSSSSLSSSPSSSPPSSSSPSPTGGKKHRHRHHQQQQPTRLATTTTTERHAFFRIQGEKLLETPQSVATAKAAAAAAAQRAERNLSVKRDIALDLPPCPALPDGEERPYGSSTRLRIRDHDQESEIYRECIRPPPNRTVHETPTSFPPFRCNSESILTDPSTPVGHHRMAKTAGPTTTNSSPSSILAVCCTSTTSLSSTSSSGGGGGYGYQNLSHHYHQHQPTATTARSSDSKEFFLASQSSRLLLDIHGQPIVTRSKSMSTGSTIQQPDSYLTVMVPSPPAKTLEAAVKSCVRSLRERVHKPNSPSCVAQPTVGVDNAGYESSRRWPSATTTTTIEHQQSTEEQQPSSSNRSKLASLPVVSCASASTPSKPDGT